MFDRLMKWYLKRIAEKQHQYRIIQRDGKLFYGETGEEVHLGE